MTSGNIESKRARLHAQSIRGGPGARLISAWLCLTLFGIISAVITCGAVFAQESSGPAVQDNSKQSNPDSSNQSTQESTQENRQQDPQVNSQDRGPNRGQPRVGEKEEPAQSALDPQTHGAPDSSEWEKISIDGEEIFTIRANLGPYSIKTRADNIRAVISRLARRADYPALLPTIRAINDRQVARVQIGDEVICFVTDRDAALNGDNARMVTAQKYAEKLKLALTKDLNDRRPGHLFWAVGLTAVSLFVFALILGILNWLFPKLYMLTRTGTFVKALRIQKAELMSRETMVDICIGVLRLIRVLTAFFFLSILVPTILSFYPDTRGLAGDMAGYMLRPLRDIVVPAILAYLPNTLVIAAVAIATYYSVAFIHFVFREMERGNITIAGFDREWADPTYKIVRFLVITFSFVMIFPYLPGSGSPAFQQVSIFLGVLFSLGSTGAISHLVAGVFLTYTGAFKVGDRVKIADTVGDVMEKTLLATRIRTIKQEYITIPNGLVLSSHIINYSASAGKPGLILHTTVTIGYDAPWRDVHEALCKAAAATDGINGTPEPFVLQTSLDDYYVSYQLNAYTDRPESMALTYSLLHQNIQDKFNEAGIEIMSPGYTALRDGNKPTIPDSYRAGDDEIRGFRVKMH